MKPDRIIRLEKELLILRRIPFLYCAVWIATGCGFAQHDPAPQASSTKSSYCASVVGGLRHAEALESFCGWVLSFDTRLPNIIGNQETHRYRLGHGKDHELIDTVSARVAYIEGRPRVSDLAINHVSVQQEDDLPENAPLHGAASYGDYGSDLRLLLGSHTITHFSFASENVVHGMPVLVFDYEVREGDNHRWAMKAREKTGAPLQTVFPAYQGRILLDAKSFALIRFERETTKVEKHFPLRFGSNQVDYKLLPLGDGTSFDLPVASAVTFCHDDKHRRCEINETKYENWLKFGAKTRILTNMDQN